MVKVTLRVREEQAEEVLDGLLPRVPHGVHERTLGDQREIALVGRPEELPSRTTLRRIGGRALRGISSEEVPDEWRERRTLFYEPLTIGGRVAIRPPWAPPVQGTVDVVVDGADAFGTGAHPTTRACIELMLTLEARGSFADLGTGSGVLAITAAKLGWAPVIAVDSERPALDAARANAAANGVSVDARRVDLVGAPAPPAETVVANLPAPVLACLAAKLEEPPVTLIASGIRSDAVEAVVAMFAARGLRERARRPASEWVALLLEREES